MMPAVRHAGDRGALIELPDSAAAVRLTRALAGRSDLVDVVPGHCTVLVTWAGERPHDLEALAASALAGVPALESARTVEIPVVYDGTDLEEVARLVGLSPEEVVERHVAAEYAVAFIGFGPASRIWWATASWRCRGLRGRANASRREAWRSPAPTPGSTRASRRAAGGSSAVRRPSCSTRNAPPALLRDAGRVRFTRLSNEVAVVKAGLLTTVQDRGRPARPPRGPAVGSRRRAGARAREPHRRERPGHRRARGDAPRAGAPLHGARSRCRHGSRGGRHHLGPIARAWAGCGGARRRPARAGPLPPRRPRLCGRPRRLRGGGNAR